MMKLEIEESPQEEMILNGDDLLIKSDARIIFYGGFAYSQIKFDHAFPINYHSLLRSLHFPSLAFEEFTICFCY